MASDKTINSPICVRARTPDIHVYTVNCKCICMDAQTREMYVYASVLLHRSLYVDRIASWKIISDGLLRFFSKLLRTEVAVCYVVFPIISRFELEDFQTVYSCIVKHCDDPFSSKTVEGWSVVSDRSAQQDKSLRFQITVELHDQKRHISGFSSRDIISRQLVLIC